MEITRMPDTAVTQEEFKRLEVRVSAVEHEVDGEKLLSRYILNQARQNGDDLAALKARVDRIEEKVDHLGHRMGRIETDLSSLRRELPAIIADAMREVLREGRSR
jgi:tetrahydromethanopterin S-methyltransferase subunit G